VDLRRAALDRQKESTALLRCVPGVKVFSIHWAHSAADAATEAAAASAARVQHDDRASATCEVGVCVPGKGAVRGRAVRPVTEREVGAVGAMAQAGGCCQERPSSVRHPR